MPDKNQYDVRGLKELLKLAIEKIAPDLRKTMALPRRAKVMEVKPAGGTYVCSVQAVLNDGSPDPDAPLIPNVEIPTVWAGPNRGVVCPPTVGEYCDLVFYDGDLNYPHITNFRPSEAPEAELDSLMIQHSPGIRLGFKPDGTVIIEAPNIEAVATGHITAKADTIEAAAQTHIKAAAPLIEATAETKITMTAPVVDVVGHLRVSDGISAVRGNRSVAVEIDGPVKIINGGLDSERDVTSQANITADGGMAAAGNIEAGNNINAGGDIMAAGRSDNHHGH